jgi:hypothetical protein
LSGFFVGYKIVWIGKHRREITAFILPPGRPLSCLLLTNDRSHTGEPSRGDTHSTTLHLPLATPLSMSAATDVVYDRGCTLKCPASYAANGGADSSFRRLETDSWKSRRQVCRMVRDMPGRRLLSSLLPVVPWGGQFARAAPSIVWWAKEGALRPVRTRSGGESEQEQRHLWGVFEDVCSWFCERSPVGTNLFRVRTEGIRVILIPSVSPLRLFKHLL